MKVIFGIVVLFLLIVGFYWISNDTKQEESGKKIVDITVQIEQLKAQVDTAADEAGIIGRFFDDGVSSLKDKIEALEDEREKLIQASGGENEKHIWIGLIIGIMATVAIPVAFESNTESSGISVGASPVTFTSGGLGQGLMYLFIGYPILLWISWWLIT